MVDTTTSNTTNSGSSQDNKWANHEFVTPKKALADVEQMEKFKQGKSYKNIMQFFSDLQ